MKVVIGSENKDKIKILENALKEIYLEVEVLGVKTDSQITNQPLDKETTKAGAINRARNAKKEKPDADFWFGLESGLQRYKDEYYLITFACLINQSAQEFIGVGKEIILPKKVSEEVENGGWYGEVIRSFAKINEIDTNLISRIIPFTEAIQDAYAEYLKGTASLGYRGKAIGVVIDQEDNYLLDQLNNYGENDWNFSGGGIEEGERAEGALLREFGEELGTNKFEIIKKSKHQVKYEWPNSAIIRKLKMLGHTYRGQSMQFFLVNFTGSKTDIKPDPIEIRKVK